MMIHEHAIDDVVVVTIGDGVTSNVATARLADAVRDLIQEGRCRIVVDLGGVRYLDSGGLGELVQCCAAVRAAGGVIKLVNVTRRLNDLLVVTKLLTVFDCYDSETDAIESFHQAA
jgi:anti-sigma B factor antagonist